MATWSNRRAVNTLVALVVVALVVSGGFLSGRVSAQGERITLTMSA